jgi:NTP pyrophosphatase (non-canonical NTP hydrolase)
MAAELLVNMHEITNSYVKNARNRSLARDISGDLIQLSRAVIKKHTFPNDKAFKYHLAQPSRMLSRAVVLWHKVILRKMRKKPTCSRPWTVRFTWNFPTEIFNCLKVIAETGECGGVVAKNTRNVEEIHVKQHDKLIYLFSTLANKYKISLSEEEILFKREKDSSYSKIVVNESHPAKFKYSKSTEILTFSARYGHFNRFGVPQYTLE